MQPERGSFFDCQSDPVKTSNPVVLVTGASRGIGRAIALAFAKKKSRIGINFIQSEEKSNEVIKEIKSLGGEGLLLKADVSDSSQVRIIVNKLMGKWGRIDILINNAGITRDRTILKMSDEEWNDVIRVNLTGAFWCLRECAKIMARQKEGSIVNISSIIGIRGSVGNPNYAAAKAGLIGLTKAAAKELGRFNISVNAILPGFHPTDMSSMVWNEQAEKIRQEHALGRLTDLNELADFIVAIAKQKSASGQVFNFDSRVI